MIAAIHQPNFMPWYPFFQKIAAADVFVLLTHCQFEKNNFQNRFNLGGRWHTLSVNKGLQPIREKRYVDPEKDWNKICVNLQEHRSELSLFDKLITDNLAQTNIAIIRTLCERLGITTTITTDYETELKSSERLVDLCESVGATTYLAGSGGSREYLDLAPFHSKDINVEFQDPESMVRMPILQFLATD